jgi:hypothetical protein
MKMLYMFLLSKAKVKVPIEESKHQSPDKSGGSGNTTSKNNYKS